MKRSSDPVAGNARGSAERCTHSFSASGDAEWCVDSLGRSAWLGAEWRTYALRDHENKRRRCVQPSTLETNVAFISFPLKTYTHKAEQGLAIEAIRQVVQSGADVINLAFARSSDIDAFWPNITTHFNRRE